MPVPVAHSQQFDGVLLAITIEYGSAIFARIMVDAAERVTLLVCLPT